MSDVMQASSTRIDMSGEDVENFRPERWMTNDMASKYAMENGFLGFGAGKRVCMGRHIAELEMKKVISLLVLHFEVCVRWHVKKAFWGDGADGI